MASDSVLYRNEPRTQTTTGGRLARGSNAMLMRDLPNPEQYSAGLIHKIAQYATGCLLSKYMEKQAGEEREPEVDRHESAPQDKLRPRSELVLYTRDGVYAIDNGDYLLFPGGGVDDGEQPRDAAIRETIEESNRHPINVVNAGVVESVWPENSGNEFWDESEFDGERTYFFTGLDAGEAGITHDDLEDFEVMPFNTVLSRLTELSADAEQAWAKRNNDVRRRLVAEAKRLAKTKENLKPVKQAQVQQEMPVPPTTPGSVVEQVGLSKSRAHRFVDQLVAQQQQAPAAPTAAPQAPAVPEEPVVPEAPMSPAPVAEPVPKVAGDLIEGGLADDKPDARYDERELAKGKQVELEHTDDPAAATEIAKDHLEEIPDYYTRLAALEHEAKELVEDGQEKVADVAQFMPRSEYLMFTPDDQLVVQRRPQRRIGLPAEGMGKRAPYESQVKFVPDSGVPEEGYHGYDIGLNIGEANEVPEGYEAVPATEVLKELYASMGLAANKPFRQLDRTRARVIMRYLKKKAKERKLMRETTLSQFATQPQPVMPQPQPAMPDITPAQPVLPEMPGATTG